MREVQARGFPPGRAEHRAPAPQEFEEQALGWAFRSGSDFCTATEWTRTTGTSEVTVIPCNNAVGSNMFHKKRRRRTHL